MFRQPSVKRVVLSLACLLLLVACGGTPATPTTPAAPPAAELPLLNDAIASVNQAAPADGWAPLDSVPSPDAQTIYFTANGSSGPAVYSVAAAGGEVTALASGAPFIAPWGLSISTDGQTLYVADLGGEAASDGNVIFALPTSGGTPTRLEPTAGSRPNVPEIVSENGTDTLYYSGFDPADQQPAIFKLDPSQDAAPSVVFKGAPLSWPSGVAVTKAGIVYVVDMEAAGNARGALFRIQEGKAEKLADQIRTSGWIAGATLTLDDALLLVSTLHAEQGTAQVLVVNIASGELGLINKGISENTGAGGVHRAHQVNAFSWADFPTRPPIVIRPPFQQAAPADGGGVYNLTTP